MVIFWLGGNCPDFLLASYGHVYPIGPFFHPPIHSSIHWSIHSFLHSSVYPSINPQSLCIAVAALTHYFYLVGFGWMLVEGLVLFAKVVKVFNIRLRLGHYYAAAWGKGRSASDTVEMRFLPCGHFDLESAVTAQDDEFKGSFRSSFSRLLHVKTWPRNSILSLDVR